MTSEQTHHHKSCNKVQLIFPYVMNANKKMSQSNSPGVLGKKLAQALRVIFTRLTHSASQSGLELDWFT
jgi:hypothetical protein